MKKILTLVIMLVMLSSAFAYNGIGNAYGRNEPVDRTDIVHYFDGTFSAKGGGNAKPGGGGGSKGSACYKANLWIQTPVKYYINPDSKGELVSDYSALFGASAETWQAQTSRDLWDTSSSTTLTPGTYDGNNVVGWDLLSSGTIAVTSIWYYRYSHEIVEWDMTFNTFYDWSMSSASISNRMDFQNIATHEIGHTLGLADVYQGSCNYVTMYGYSGYGDISKRDLEQPDIKGLQSIYGI